MDFSILSKYDDFLANYFLDNLFLWFPTIRMNSTQECGLVDTNDAIPIIRQRVAFDLNPAKATKELIQLPYFKEFLKNMQERQIFEFSQHMRRYICMFMPSAGFEVSSTTRYTGKLEACIVATQDWKVGQKVALCQGSIAKLTTEEDERLKSEGRDFSVMVSTRKKCACLFLGPARFMNHDCDANCEFILVGSNAVTFKVNKNIKRGEEMTVFYGKHYFGEDNCECLCASCERRQEGSFSKSEKTVIDENVVIEKDTSTTRRSSRKRKENINYRNYELDKRLRTSQTNENNTNEQRLPEPTSGNQCIPKDLVSTNIPEKSAQNTGNIETEEEDCIGLNLNLNSPKETSGSEVNMSTLDKDQDSLEIADTSSQNTRSTEMDNLNKEKDNTMERRRTSLNDINEDTRNSTETQLASSPVLVDSLPNTNDNNNKEDEESIVPDINTLDNNRRISKDAAVDSLPIEDSSLVSNKVCDPDRIEIEATSNEVDDEHIHQIVDVNDDNTPSTIQNNIIKEVSANGTENTNNQLSLDEGITLSEGYKEVEIVFSEGISTKSKIRQQKTQLLKEKDEIRQVRSVVINGVSHKGNSLNKDIISTVCDIWIPVNKTTKKQVNTALQELKNDIQKNNDMENRANEVLTHDINHSLNEETSSHAPDNNHNTLVNYSPSPELEDKTNTSSQSEKRNNDNNLLALVDYSSSPEPEDNHRASTNQMDLKDGADKTSTRKHTENIDDSSTLKNGSIELANVPETIITRQEAEKMTDQTTDFSFVQQQEKETTLILDDLSQSYTSSSNDSTCFSSNDFDTTDTNSPISLSSSDNMLIRQGSDLTKSPSPQPNLRNNPISKENDSTGFNRITCNVDNNTLNIPPPREEEATRTADMLDDPFTSSLNDDLAINHSNKSTTTTTTTNVDNTCDASETTLSSLDLSISTAATSPTLTNTDNFFDTPLSVGTSPDLNTINSSNTETTTNHSCSTATRETAVKPCCPEFYKYELTVYDGVSMCPRCLRHFRIFGMEWPKRVGKKSPKYKTKGSDKRIRKEVQISKNNQKKDFRTKHIIQKQSANKTPVQNAANTLIQYTFNEVILSSEFERTNTTMIKSKAPHQITLVLPKKKGRPRLTEEEKAARGQKATSKNKTIENTPSVNTTTTNPILEKSKPKKPSYYYELVPIDQAPEPEPILKHPSKPYALRIKESHNDAHQTPALEKAVSPKKMKEMPKKPSKPETSKKTSPMKASNKTKPEKPSSLPQTPKVPKTYKKESNYYYYELVLEDETAEENLIIDTDPDKPYAFRSRSHQTKHSDALSKKDQQDTTMPTAGPEKQASIETSSRLLNKSTSIQKGSEQNSANSILNSPNISLQMTVKENPKKAIEQKPRKVSITTTTNSTIKDTNAVKEQPIKAKKYNVRSLTKENHASTNEITLPKSNIEKSEKSDTQNADDTAILPRTTRSSSKRSAETNQSTKEGAHTELADKEEEENLGNRLRQRKRSSDAMERSYKRRNQSKKEDIAPILNVTEKPITKSYSTRAKSQELVKSLPLTRSHENKPCIAFKVLRE